MKRLLFAVLVLALLVSTFAVSAQGSTNCQAPDYSAVEQALAQADTAMNSGDIATSLQARASANQLYRAIQAECVLTPLAQSLGIDPALMQATVNMPLCQYHFDATVRSGTDLGVNVHGTLSLLQNTPTSAVGYVYTSLNGDPVPVAATFGNQNDVTLTFTLPSGSIVGTGLVDSSISTCFGTIQGQLTGPAADDKGDWLGSAFNCLDSKLPCLPDVVIPKPQQPPSGGACTADAGPVCQQVCGSDGTCKIQCTGTVGKICTGK